MRFFLEEQMVNEMKQNMISAQIKRERKAVQVESLKWELGYSAEQNQQPDKFIPAVVPGSVQLDIARDANYPDYNYADNYRLFRWMEDMYFTYRTKFDLPNLKSNEKLWFVSKGIDYQFEIYFNNKLIHAQEGMYVAVELDLTSYLKQSNVLEVKIMPAPKRFAFPEDKKQASHVTKPPVSYGWDWHPRLIPLGIWDDTFIEIRNTSFVNDVYVDYELSDDFSVADIKLKASAVLENEHPYRWELKDAEGYCVLSSEGMMESLLDVALTLKSPKLWWPHDHGVPYLYISSFYLIDNNGEVIQSVKNKIGFRKVQLVMNEGAWDEPAEFPKTRSVPPAQIELNGRKIFAKGTNWVNPEVFPGIITDERYRELLDIVVATNFNIVRTWGGSIINKASFFELCDTLGIMVWQEFPLSCNHYPDDSAYLTLLENEARAIIKRIRKHPSLMLWCGGNELFNSWSGMTDQSLALRMLNALCYELDRDTPFISTSPLFGIAHGNYVFRWKGQEVFEMMNKSHHTAYAETGLPGISPLETLKRIIPANQLFPPQEGTAWEDHHAFNAWDASVETWLCQDILKEYMDPAKSIEELIFQSQLLQSEGYKAIYEAARRQKPYCSMVLNWCFNEPWPTAANNSLLAYPSVPKPALAAVRDACRPLCASAVIYKFVWHENELFTTDLWFLNDSLQVLADQRITVSLQAGNEKLLVSEWKVSEVKPNMNVAGPTISCKLPSWNVQFFKLIVEVQEDATFNAEYTLIYRKGKN